MDKILAVRGATGSPARAFKVRWKGYGAGYDTWEGRNNLHPDAINEFLQTNGIYDNAWPGVRCQHCDRPCRNIRALHSHQRFCQMLPDKAQNFDGTRAARKVLEDKMVAAQSLLPQVNCESAKLENVFHFKYLGSMYAADGDQRYDVRRRIGMAMTRMGQLRQVFNASISFGTKMRLYKTAVTSLTTYGCEA